MNVTRVGTTGARLGAAPDAGATATARTARATTRKTRRALPGRAVEPRIASTVPIERRIDAYACDVRAPPRLRGGLAARLTLLVLGLFLFAAGIVAFLESRLGLSPWDVLHQGIARRSPLSFGVANVVVGLFVLTIAWLLGATIGIATLANAVLVGAFIELLTSIGAIDHLSNQSLGIRIALVVAGVLLAGLGSGLYLGADLGAGPRDSLMVVGTQRTSLRVAVVRGVLELSALVVGFALGGTIGLGTVAFALLIGPSVEASFWALERSGLTARTRV
jgi:uncharacterized protein